MRRSIFNRIGLAAIAGCVVLGALAVAGCGSSSSTTGASGASGASGSAPLSQSEFVSQANAVCKQYQDAYGALKPPSNSTSDVAAYAAQLLPLANRAHAQLAALTPPSDLQAKYAQYLSDQKSQIGLVQDMESAAKAGDASKASAALQKVEAGADQVNSEAQDLGLTVCGNA